MNPTWLAGGIFLLTYALIVTERVHRTVSALLGGVAMILLGLLPQEQAFHAIDWNVIFLLAGMMAIANVLRETGLFHISQILASNIGGTATLIGDPPNILIGSAAGIDFLTFAAHLTPISILILFAFIGLAWFLFKKDLRGDPSHSLEVEALDTSALITDRSLLRKGLIVMTGVILGFLTHGALHLDSSSSASSSPWKRWCRWGLSRRSPRPHCA